MIFLSLEEAIAIHRVLINLHGGAHGLRDEGPLASALAQPAATFGGTYLHRDPFEMAAAYAYHLSLNHPFLDGNKRIAAVSMGAFLGANGHEVSFNQAELVAAMLALAEGRLDKPALTAWIRQQARTESR